MAYLPFEKGGAEKFDTATEPALIQQGTNMRRDERGSMLEDFICRNVRKIASILQQTLIEKDFALEQEDLGACRRVRTGEGRERYGE